MSASPRRRALLVPLATAIALVAAAVLAIRRNSIPPAPRPATAPDTAFSAERAMRHVRAIAAQPRPIGTPAHDSARAYIAAELTRLGLTPRVQETTGISPRGTAAGRVRNVLAWLPGRATGQAVLLAVHYDGVAAGPAAGDDAAGVAALLETMRALRAGPQLEHDLIALFTDGEESGLLGADAFVREHPWAKDVAFVLNFEARGTGGRSYMFETGAGNLDAARLLRGIPDVSASSLFPAVYRALPNDTDLTVFLRLGKPAMNFAFIDGLPRYHTPYDDVAHLDPGSVQHHGAQMLALTRRIANGPLPRPAAGDGVFVDLPLLGVVAYSVSGAPFYAFLALGFALAFVITLVKHDRPAWKGVIAGAGATLATLVLAAMLAAYGLAPMMDALHAAVGGGTSHRTSALPGATVMLLVLAIVVSAYALARRFASLRALHTGALVAWGAIGLLVALSAPAASFLLLWPLLAMLVVPHLRPPVFPPVAAQAALWLAAAFALVLVLPVAWTAAVTALGIGFVGNIVLAAFTSLLAWLLLPFIEGLSAGRPGRLAALLATGGVASLLLGTALVRHSERLPAPASLVHAIDADEPARAWLVGAASATRGNAWARSLFAGGTEPPEWAGFATRGIGGSLVAIARAPAGATPLAPPSAEVLYDTLTQEGRRLTLRVTATGADIVRVLLPDARVRRVTIDGRLAAEGASVPQPWGVSYVAPADSGFMIGMILADGAPADVEMAAIRYGLPPDLVRAIPSRPAHVVPIGTGDLTVTRVRRRF